MDWYNLLELTSVSPWLLIGVVLLGIVTGLLTGMFGIGGAFITTPALISLFAIEPTTAVACAFGYTIGGSTLGIPRHRQMGHIEWKAIAGIGLGACTGILIGFLVHNQLADFLGQSFKIAICAAFIVVLVPIAWLVGFKTTSETQATRSTIFSRIKLPPYVRLQSGERVSLSVMILSGLAVGLIRGALGIGGGVLLVPLLIFVVGLKPHKAVGTSLGVILAGSVVGCFLYGARMDWIVVGLMIIGGFVGIRIGSQLCGNLKAAHLQRAFAIVLLFAAGLMLVDLSFELITPIENLSESTATPLATPIH